MSDEAPTDIVQLIRGLTAQIADLRAELRELRGQPQVQPSLTIKEAAVLLKCNRAFVFELLNGGKLERTQRVGKNVRITRTSLDKLLSEPEVRETKRRRERKPRQKKSMAAPDFTKLKF